MFPIRPALVLTLLLSMTGCAMLDHTLNDIDPLVCPLADTDGPRITLTYSNPLTKNTLLVREVESGSIEIDEPLMAGRCRSSSTFKKEREWSMIFKKDPRFLGYYLPGGRAGTITIHTRLRLVGGKTLTSSSTHAYRIDAGRPTELTIPLAEST